MKCDVVVDVFYCLSSKWVGRVSGPTAGCVLGSDRSPWEGELLGLAPWEARISLVLTIRCGVRHFLTNLAGEDAQNKLILLLCCAHFFEFGTETLTRDSDEAHQNNTRRTRKKQKIR